MSTLIYSEQKNEVHLTSEQIKVILEGCKRGQRDAQKKLYRIYYSYAMAIALRYSSNYDNAVEMTNDGFLKVYRDLKNFVPRYDKTVAAFMGWFKKIVVNACIDHIRKYNRKEMMATVDANNLTLADERETAEQMLQHKEIIKCIQQLSPIYKAVFNLHVIEGFSHAEIAEKLNISEGTSKSNLFKARQNLQQLLQKSNIISYERTL